MTLRAYLWSSLLLLVFAADASATAGWTGRGRISELQVSETGRVTLRLEVSENPSGCRDGSWFYREQGPGTSQMLDVLLTAADAGRTVAVYVTGICHFKGYSEFSAVSLMP